MRFKDDGLEATSYDRTHPVVSFRATQALVDRLAELSRLSGDYLRQPSAGAEARALVISALRRQSETAPLCARCYLPTERKDMSPVVLKVDGRGVTVLVCRSCRDLDGVYAV